MGVDMMDRPSPRSDVYIGMAWRRGPKETIGEVGGLLGRKERKIVVPGLLANQIQYVAATNYTQS